MFHGPSLMAVAADFGPRQVSLSLSRVDRAQGPAIRPGGRMSEPSGKRPDLESKDDPTVATSRAGKADDNEGTYVGETEPDESVDVGETGAEARSEKDDR